MRFGIHLIQQNITLAECRDLWRWADTAGFDWFDVSDHFYESPMTEKRGPYLECLTCLAALACDTQHMRIGTVVLAMDCRHPAVLANALAASDAHRPAANAHFAEVFGASGDAFRTRGAITGTPAEAIEQLAPYAEAGVDRINIALRPPIDGHALQAWATQVIPAFVA